MVIRIIEKTPGKQLRITATPGPEGPVIEYRIYTLTEARGWVPGEGLTISARELHIVNQALKEIGEEPLSPQIVEYFQRQAL